MDQPSTQAKGVADFIIFTPQTVLCVECKQPGKKLTMEQLAFAAQVSKLGWPHKVVYTFNEFLDFVTCTVSTCRAPVAVSPSK